MSQPPSYYNATAQPQPQPQQVVYTQVPYQQYDATPVVAPVPVSVVRVEFQDHRGPCTPCLNLLWVIFGGGFALFLIWG